MDIDRTYIVGDKDSFSSAIDQIHKLKTIADFPVQIRVKRHRTKRNISQNNLFWVWMRDIANYTGDDPESMHDYFCAKFLGKEMKKVLNEDVERVKGTRNLNKKEMAEFLERIQIFCQQELNLTLDNNIDE